MKKEYFIIIIIIFSLFTGCNLFEDTSGTNQKPVANAGGDKVITIGDTVLLDGSGSNDKDDDSLTYNWSFVVKPSESTAVLSDSGIENPSFTADKVGNYIIQLIVNDGELDSDYDDVIITAEFAGKVVTPSFEPPEGTYDSDQNVVIQAVP